MAEDIKTEVSAVEAPELNLGGMLRTICDVL